MNIILNAVVLGVLVVDMFLSLRCIEAVGRSANAAEAAAAEAKSHMNAAKVWSQSANASALAAADAARVSAEAKPTINVANHYPFAAEVDVADVAVKFDYPELPELERDCE